MKNIVLFGPPGSGKGTQAANIVAKYNLIHLSTGDMLRSEIQEGTTLGLKAKVLMDKGELVPDAVVVGMIDNKLNANPNAAGFVFDGFPRTVAQAEALDKLLANRNIPIQKVLSLKVSEQELTKRILERGKSSGRPDDQNEEIVKNRVVEYRTKTEPLAAYYAKQDKLVEIPGEGTVDHIADSLSYEIDTITNGGSTGGAPQTALAPVPKKKEDKVPFPLVAVKNVTFEKTTPSKPKAKKVAPKKATPVKKNAPRKAAPKKALKKATPKKAVKAAKKVAPKKAVKKAAPKKAVKKAAPKKATKKAAPKKATKKTAKKAIKKAAPKKAVKNISKNLFHNKTNNKVGKSTAKSVTPKKAVSAVKKAVKKAAPKKAVAAVKKAVKKAVKAVKKAVAPKKAAVKKAVAKKAAPKKAVAKKAAGKKK
ncbi:MAG: adenylate kinase [Bacteroidetes bacterium]|nr:adenylate kinase [Bacteroidota bacterium]